MPPRLPPLSQSKVAPLKSPANAAPAGRGVVTALATSGDTGCRGTTDEPMAPLAAARAGLEATGVARADLACCCDPGTESAGLLVLPVPAAAGRGWATALAAARDTDTGGTADEPVALLAAGRAGREAVGVARSEPACCCGAGTEASGIRPTSDPEVTGDAVRSWAGAGRAGRVDWGPEGVADGTPDPRRTEAREPTPCCRPGSTEPFESERPPRSEELLVEIRSDDEEPACRVAPADPDVSANATGSDTARDPTPRATAKAPIRPT